MCGLAKHFIKHDIKVVTKKKVRIEKQLKYGCLPKAYDYICCTLYYINHK